jgi:hypothetical protein
VPAQAAPSPAPSPATGGTTPAAGGTGPSPAGPAPAAVPQQATTKRKVFTENPAARQAVHGDSRSRAEVVDKILDSAKLAGQTSKGSAASAHSRNPRPKP